MKKIPDRKGHFGKFGGKFVPEVLFHALAELEKAYLNFKKDKTFQREFKSILKSYVGRPTPLFYARNLTKKLRGARIYLKREDLCHTGAHKINNTIGQALLAVKLGKRRIIAETGAGQHGLATATAAKYFGLSCIVYMGEEDIKRQAPNVYKMKLLGAEVRPVYSGSRTLKDATNEAIRDWVTNVDTTHYILGSTVGPHPYPMIVRDFQLVIGQETKRQLRQEGKTQPDYLVACVGGGSNSLGLFYPFLKSTAKMIGVEAAGKGLATRHHAAALMKGDVGVLHGMKSYVLQNKDGQIQLAHSISAGLDYPGVGPEHAYLKESGRVQYVSITDKEALEGFQMLIDTEAIIAALESSHAIAYLRKLAPKLSRNKIIVLCLSGRGDKDLPIVREHLNIE